MAPITKLANDLTSMANNQRALFTRRPDLRPINPVAKGEFVVVIDDRTAPREFGRFAEWRLAQTAVRLASKAALTRSAVLTDSFGKVYCRCNNGTYLR